MVARRCEESIDDEQLTYAQRAEGGGLLMDVRGKEGGSAPDA